MRQNNRVFLEETSRTPVLYFDLVFVEYCYPVLFTCRDDNGQMYIVSCHMANGEKCEWLIAKTSPGLIIKMLSDEATIRSMFTVNDTLDIVTQCAEKTNITINTVKVCDVPSSILPTENEYMEPDEGEFDEEIDELRQRVSMGVPIKVFWEELYVSSYEAFVTISTSPIVAISNFFNDFGTQYSTRRMVEVSRE